MRPFYDNSMKIRLVPGAMSCLSSEWCWFEGSLNHVFINDFTEKDGSEIISITKKGYVHKKNQVCEKKKFCLVIYNSGAEPKIK
jgi:hypothetical protein